VQDDEVADAVEFVDLQPVVFLHIARIEGAIRKDRCQLGNATLDEMDTGGFQRLEKAARPLSDLRSGRSIHIPSPFPGLWNYWRMGPPQRGRPGDHVHWEDVERLQLMVAAEDTASDDAKSLEVESVLVHFDAANMQAMP
jgi:hypothetical protein